MVTMCLSRASVIAGLVFTLCLTIVVSGCTSQAVTEDASTASPTTAGTSPPPTSPPATAPADTPTPNAKPAVTAEPVPIPTTTPFPAATPAPAATPIPGPSPAVDETPAPTPPSSGTPDPAALPTCTAERTTIPTPEPTWTEAYRYAFHTRSYHYLNVDRERDTAQIIVEFDARHPRTQEEMDEFVYRHATTCKGEYYLQPIGGHYNVSSAGFQTFDHDYILDREEFIIEDLRFSFFHEDMMIYTLAEAGPPGEPFKQPPYGYAKLRFMHWPSLQNKEPPGPLYYYLLWWPYEHGQPTPEPFAGPQWTPDPTWTPIPGLTPYPILESIPEPKQTPFLAPATYPLPASTEPLPPVPAPTPVKNITPDWIPPTATPEQTSEQTPTQERYPPIGEPEPIPPPPRPDPESTLENGRESG